MRKQLYILIIIWTVRLLSLVLRRNTLSRLTIDPFLRYFFSLALLVIIQEKRMSSKKLNIFGKIIMILYYLLLLVIMLVFSLLIPRDYFDLWFLGIMIFFLIFYLMDRIIRKIVTYFFSLKKEHRNR